jgi:hypothetical protein
LSFVVGDRRGDLRHFRTFHTYPRQKDRRSASGSWLLQQRPVSSRSGSLAGSLLAVSPAEKLEARVVAGQSSALAARHMSLTDDVRIDVTQRQVASKETRRECRIIL